MRGRLLLEQLFLELLLLPLQVILGEVTVLAQSARVVWPEGVLTIRCHLQFLLGGFGTVVLCRLGVWTLCLALGYLALRGVLLVGRRG